jgi:acyl-CoA dehydrogenase
MNHADLFPVPAAWLGENDAPLADTIARWAEHEVETRRLELREDVDALLLPAYQKLAVDIGLQSMLWPEAWGGGGLARDAAATTAVVAIEQTARADVGLGLALANLFALQASIAFSAEPPAGAQRFSEAICGTEKVLASLVLPGYGATHDANAPLIGGLCYPAAIDGDDQGWLVNGGGRPQFAGRDATVLVVVASHENGPALVLVPGDAAGLLRGDALLKTGLAAGRNCELTFSDVKLAADAVIASGEDALFALRAWYHLGAAACCLGAQWAAWKIVKDWGEARVIKGKGQVFKENPLVASSLGDIGAALGTTRLLVYGLAQLIGGAPQHGAAAIHAASTATLWQTVEAAMTSLNRCLELMASAGYATEWEIERYWRDVKTLGTYLGPRPTARIDLARHYFDLQTL